MEKAKEKLSKKIKEIQSKCNHAHEEDEYFLGAILNSTCSNCGLITYPEGIEIGHPLGWRSPLIAFKWKTYFYIKQYGDRISTKRDKYRKT